MLVMPDVIACRGCGATHAAPSEMDGVCEACHSAYRRWLGRRGKGTADTFNRWLARQLELNVKRLRRYGVTGRCEAISHWWDAAKPGAQCALPAITVVNGHKLCHSHAHRTDAAILVQEATANQYEYLADLLSDMGRADPDFVQCMRTALDRCRT